ncbi:MAG: hypothetical protein HQL55_06710 [Magnetococcales bacterium]|nr:hypothetical protein [Magnetococcales bacterium]
MKFSPLHTRFNPTLLRWIKFFFLLLSITLPTAQAGQSYFSSRASLIQEEQLRGTLEITLHGDTTLYQPQLLVHGQTLSQELARWSHWLPGQRQNLVLELPGKPNLPGNYHLLLEITGLLENGQAISLLDGLPYHVGARLIPPPIQPTVHLHGAKVTWQTAGIPDHQLSLTLVPAPFSPTVRLTSRQNQLELAVFPSLPVAANSRFESLARLDWSWQGNHYSVLTPWLLESDDQGRWQRFPWSHPTHIHWARDGGLWQSLAGLCMLVALYMGGGQRPSGEPHALTHAWPVTLLMVTLLAFTLPWQPWPQEWEQLVTILPILLLPITAHWLGFCWRWPPLSRIWAAAATLATLLMMDHWGSGAFAAKGWSMVILLLFFATIGRLLHGFGGRWLAVLLAMILITNFPATWLVAMVSHLFLGFFLRAGWAGVVRWFSIQISALLLSSWWWLPGFSLASLPSLAEEGIRWQHIFPPEGWPFFLLVALWRGGIGGMAPLAVALGAASVWLATRLEVTHALQWGFMVTGGMVLGAYLTTHLRRPLLWTLAALALLPAWWEQELTQQSRTMETHRQSEESRASWPFWQQLNQYLHHNPPAGHLVVAPGHFVPRTLLEPWQNRSPYPWQHRLQKELAKPVIQPDTLLALMGKTGSQALVIQQQTTVQQLLQDKRFKLQHSFGPLHLLTASLPAPSPSLMEKSTVGAQFSWLALSMSFLGVAILLYCTLVAAPPLPPERMMQAPMPWLPLLAILLGLAVFYVLEKGVI